MVTKKYEEYIEDCKNVIEKNNNEIAKLNPEKTYQIRNKIYTWKIRSIVVLSMLPFILSIFIGIFISDYIGVWGFRLMMGLSLIVGVILDRFLEKDKQDYSKDLVKEKSQAEIIKLFIEQKAKVAEYKFRNKIEEKVIGSIDVRVRHINSLSDEFSIEIREHKDKKEILDKYEELNIAIQEEESKINEYAIKQQILDHMSFIFKGGLMDPIGMSALMSICAMMYWNIPTMIKAKGEETIGASMFEIIIPFIVCLIISAIYTYVNRRIYKKAFRLLNEELLEKIDLKKEAYYIQKDLQDKINNTEQTIIDKKLEMAELSLAL